MVLRHALVVLLLVGCKQSLFQQGGDDDPTVDSGVTGDGQVQQNCGAMCLGDAAKDFGDPKWQYLEDKRNRTWTPMTMSAGAFVGADPANKVSTCAMTSSAPACAALPGALLLSSAGGTSAADPALAWKSATKQVVKLTVRVRIEGDAAQQVLLYRNSREDSLYAALGQPGTTVETSLQVDALENDRFLLALAPAAAGAANVGVHFYVNGTGLAFPQQCVMGVQWDMQQASGKSANACGAVLTYWDDSGTTAVETGSILGAGPFPELGTAATMKENFYYEAGDIIDRSVDTTTQFWVKQAMEGFTNAAVFSDVDVYRPGGVGIYLDTTDTITAETPKSATTNEYAQASGAYPQDKAWHFVRVTHTNGMVHLCVDGKRIGGYPIPAPGMSTTKTPYVGRSPASVTAVVDGAVDDLRVYKGALPCE